jgi:hypothetical protein
MARIRTIKPEFFRHEQLQDLQKQHSDLCPMLVFAGLWTVADKAGRFEWRPRQLKLDILPFLEFEMESTLELLRSAHLVNQYEVGGKQYGEIPTFRDHQRITGKEALSPERYPRNNRESPVNTLRSQEVEKEVEKEVEVEKEIPSNSDELIFKIAQTYPESKYRNEMEIPVSISNAIIKAIGLEDGNWQSVLDFTKAYADSIDDPTYIMSPEKFYGDPRNYRRTWRKRGDKPSQYGQLLATVSEASVEPGGIAGTIRDR